MNQSVPPRGPVTDPAYLLTDASGRRYPSSAPVPAQVPAPRPYASLGGCCPHGHAPIEPAAPAQRSGLAPSTALWVTGGVTLGVVMVALVLSVAVVAVSVAVAAVAVTCCLLVMRSLVSGPYR